MSLLRRYVDTLDNVGSAEKALKYRRFHALLRLHELPLILWLAALWTMLWQQFSLLSVTSGVIVAVLVKRLFYLPPVELGGRFHPVAALKYLFYFAWELMLGSLQVSIIALRPRFRAKPAVVAVQLRTHSDFILTMTGLSISLIPGSLIADVDRYNSILYLHALHAPDDAAREKLTRDVLRIERLLVETIGSKQDKQVCADV